jgi:drug/metabolite transporter (DMT)-like permease
MTTDWIYIALLSAVALGTVNVVDSHLLSQRMPSLKSFVLPVGIIYVIIGVIFAFLFPLQSTSAIHLSAAVVSALLRATAIYLMLDLFRKEEVTVIIPVLYAYPIFVAILAIPILGESLTLLEWMAIFMVVAGAIMISIKKTTPDGSSKWNLKILAILAGCGLMLALSDISAKYALESISSQNVFWISSIIMGLVFLALTLRPASWKQLLSMPKLSGTLIIITSNEILALTGVLLSFTAIQLGPVSLVSTVFSTRPLFVVIASLIISRLYPSFLKWQNPRLIAIRVIAVLMIVGGIAIINLI